MLSGNVDPRRPDKQQRYKPPPASNNAAPGEDLTPDYMNILDQQRKSMHSSNKCSDRFKVVKIESAEPFRRGRWECMDFLDQSYNRIFQRNNAVTRQVTSEPNISPPAAELHKSPSRTRRDSVVNLHGSMLQIFYRQNSLASSDENITEAMSISPPTTDNSLHSIHDESCNKSKYHNHVLMPGMVTSSLIGIKYPLELNFIIDGLVNAPLSTPVTQASNVLPQTAEYQLPHTYKEPFINQVCCCKSRASNVVGCQFQRDVHKLQNMSSDPTHFVQTNDVQKLPNNQNVTYSLSNNHEQLNTELYNQNFNSPNTVQNAESNKQQTFVNQEQINTYNNGTENQTNQRLSSEVYATLNARYQNYDKEINSNVPAMNNQNYMNVQPKMCQQQQSINQTPNNSSYVNNNQVVSNHQQIYPKTITLNVNASNEIPTSNNNGAPIQLNLEQDQLSPLYTQTSRNPESSTQLVKNVCESSCCHNVQGNVRNEQSQSVILSNSNQNFNRIIHTTQPLCPSQVLLGGVNRDIPNQTQSNQYYSQIQGRAISVQNLQGIPQQFLMPSNSLVVPCSSNSNASHINVPFSGSNNVTDRLVGDSSLIRRYSLPQTANLVPQANIGAQSLTPRSQDVPSCVHAFLEDRNSEMNSHGNENQNRTGSNSIDTKIEALMDLVKKHLKFAVLEDVNVLKQKILVLTERVAQLEYENELLKRCDENNYKSNI